MSSAATLKTQVHNPAVRWTQIPVVNGDVIVRRDGKMLVLEDEVVTSEAARLIGCSVRHVQQMCDEGQLAEGRDWRKLPGRGRGFRHYRIRAAAVLALRVAGDAVDSEPQSRGRTRF